MVRFVKLLAFIFSTSSFGLSLQAKKDGVKLLTTASKSSAVVKTLKKGEAVEAVDRKGMYWRVKVGDKEAFVSVLKVKKITNASAISEALKDAVKQGREEGDGANVRARSAVMGVRGLDESSEVAFAGNVKPNLRMVYSMEDIIVSSGQIEKLENLVFDEAEKNAQKKGL